MSFHHHVHHPSKQLQHMDCSLNNSIEPNRASWSDSTSFNVRLTRYLITRAKNFKPVASNIFVGHRNTDGLIIYNPQHRRDADGDTEDTNEPFACIGRYRAYQLEYIAKCTTIKHNVNNSKRLLRSNFRIEYREIEQEKLKWPTNPKFYIYIYIYTCVVCTDKLEF